MEICIQTLLLLSLPSAHSVLFHLCLQRIDSVFVVLCKNTVAAWQRVSSGPQVQEQSIRNYRRILLEIPETLTQFQFCLTSILKPAHRKRGFIFSTLPLLEPFVSFHSVLSLVYLNYLQFSANKRTSSKSFPVGWLEGKKSSLCRSSFWSAAAVVYFQHHNVLVFLQRS